MTAYRNATDDAARNVVDWLAHVKQALSSGPLTVVPLFNPTQTIRWPIVRCAAKTMLDLPVSCIEHGRWHQRNNRFESGIAVHPGLQRQFFRGGSG